MRVRNNARLLRWASIAVAIALMELGIGTFFPDSLFLATPSEILRSATDVLGESRTLQALYVTGWRFWCSFMICAVGGVLLGATLGGAKHARGPSRGLLEVLFTLPQVAIYPLFILWLGVGFASKVAFGVSHGIFPVIFSTMGAIQLVDSSLVSAVRSMGGGRWAVLRMVVLPSIVPDIVSGLRLCAGLCLLGVLLAELLVSTEGIGLLIVLLSSSFQPARLYALVLTVCLAAMLINSFVAQIERRLSRWKVNSATSR